MYFWVKAFHIIAMVAWMAALLVYPRYKMHQLKSHAGEPLFETMKSASILLRKTIMIPSMIATWVFGITLLWLNPGIFELVSFWLKFLLVIGVTAMHIYFSKVGRAIDSGDTSVSASRLRMLNELPFVMLIVIVILIVVKPL